MRKENQYKSKLEIQVADYLGEDAEYEREYIEFVQPAKQRKYCPDFKTKAGIFIECKGKWVTEDRLKHVWIKAQHPDKRIILLFQNPDVKINKRSKTTYADWADKNGIEWLDWRKRDIPKELIIESKTHTRTRGRKRGPTGKPKP